MNKCKLLLLAGFIISLHVTAQKTEYSLQDCIEYALKNNISVRQSRIEVLNSQNDLTRSKHQRYPNLNFSTGFRFNQGRSIDPFTNQFVEDPVTSNNFNVSTSVNLFNGMQTYNTIQRNELLVDLSTYALDEVKNDVALNIVLLYTQILFNQELLEASKVNLEATQSLLEQTRAQVKSGVLPKINELNIESQLATDELNLVNAENALEISKLQLQQALQIPVSDDFSIVIPELDEPEVFMYALSPDEIYQVALTVMPEIKRITLNEEASEYNYEIAKGALLPSLSLSGSISTAYSSVAPSTLPRQGTENIQQTRVIGQTASGEDVITSFSVPAETISNTYFNQLDFNRNQGLFLNLNIPIYNRYNTKASINQALLSMDNAKLTSENVKNTLRQEIEQAYLDAKVASKTYESNKKQLTALEENFRMLRTQYQLGAADVFSYNQVNSDLRAAQANLVRSKYDYIVRLKILDFYQGKPIEF